MTGPGRRSIAAIAAMASLSLVAAGCGTRQSRDAIEAAAGGSSGAGASSGSSVAGGGTSNAGGTSGNAPAGDAAGAGGVGQSPAAGGSTAGAAAQAAAGDGEGSAAPGGSGAAANGTPIVIGNVSTTSGISGVAQAPGVRGLQAWVAMTNAAGGINGHPIRLVLADDGGDPARHAAAVQDLVENQGAIAFVSNWASQTIHASRPYLEAHRIPVIGGDSSSSSWFESPMLFATSPTPENAMRARLRALAGATDSRRIATMVCRESSVCSEQAAAVRRHAAEFGFALVYEGQASLAQPDFTAECLSARNAGAEVILPTFEAASMRRIAQSCDRQGYRPIYDLVAAIEPDFVDIPAFEGAVLSHPSFPPQADHPAAQQFRDALATYAPNQPPIPVAGSGWAAGVLFGQVAAAAFPPDATPATEALLGSLWSIENNTVDGLTGPLTFRRDQPVGPTSPRCMFVLRIQGGEFVAPNGLEPTCV